MSALLGDAVIVVYRCPRSCNQQSIQSLDGVGIISQSLLPQGQDRRQYRFRVWFRLISLAFTP